LQQSPHDEEDPKWKKRRRTHNRTKKGDVFLYTGYQPPWPGHSSSCLDWSTTKLTGHHPIFQNRCKKIMTKQKERKKKKKHVPPKTPTPLHPNGDPCSDLGSCHHRSHPIPDPWLPPARAPELRPPENLIRTVVAAIVVDFGSLFLFGWRKERERERERWRGTEWGREGRKY
jgi:hypothetical protein